jgi:hypothetical protein
LQRGKIIPDFYDLAMPDFIIPAGPLIMTIFACRHFVWLKIFWFHTVSGGITVASGEKGRPRQRTGWFCFATLGSSEAASAALRERNQVRRLTLLREIKK